jgi:hypothetical protein
MRPAIKKTKKNRFAILEEQTDRAHRTSAWMLRNVEDKYKPFFAVIVDFLKSATDEIATIRRDVMADWSEAELPPHEQKAMRTLSEMFPEAKPDELRKLVAKLSDDLTGSGSPPNVIG